MSRNYSPELSEAMGLSDKLSGASIAALGEYFQAMNYVMSSVRGSQKRCSESGISTSFLDLGDWVEFSEKGMNFEFFLKHVARIRNPISYSPSNLTTGPQKRVLDEKLDRAVTSARKLETLSSGKRTKESLWPREKFYKVYPYLTISFSRIAGGGGGMTGENDPKISLHFAVGKSAGHYAGKIEFEIYRNEIFIKRFVLGNPDYFLRQREEFLGSEALAQAERCGMMIEALKTLYPGFKIKHLTRIPEEDSSDKILQMMKTEAVEVLHLPPFDYSKAPRCRMSPLAPSPSMEICGFYSFDFLRDEVQKSIAIESKNIRRECDEVIETTRLGRKSLLAYCETLPFYFEWVSERRKRSIKIPFLKPLLPKDFY